jgi:starch synthase
MTRALFVNSGMLGHRAFAGLMKAITALVPGLDARHIDLSRELTVGDRLVRRLFSIRLTPRSGATANLDLRRWREELNIGLLAARRIAAAERGPEQGPPFDVLHFHTQATAYASLARMKRTPAIVSLDCTQHLASLEASSWLARASYRPNILHDGHVFRAAAALVSTSEWAARDLAGVYPDCASKMSVLPFPVDVDAFSPDWIAERASRARAVNGYRPRVLFIGGDFPRKGGPDLFEAWREGRFADRADLDIVTDWPLRADTVPPGATVITGIAPYTTPWLELWRRADLFVMPARHEAFGIVYEEAGASGIPAIGTDINAIPEILRDGGTGFLVPPGNREALVRALGMLVESSVLRERMGRAARQYVTERAAVPVYAAKLGSLIGNVVTNDVRQPA